MNEKDLYPTSAENLSTEVLEATIEHLTDLFNGEFKRAKPITQFEINHLRACEEELARRKVEN